MKQIFTILFLLSVSVSTQAQNLVCKVYYDYGAAGNRVKRHYDCKDLNQVTQEPDTKPLNAILYSNSVLRSLP